MEQRNDLAREIMVAVVSDNDTAQFINMQTKMDEFYSSWLQEAHKIQQDDKYYTLDNYAAELWVTNKQFEDDLKNNHNRYEQRISALKKD